MTVIEQPAPAVAWVQRVGGLLARYGLVVVIGWIGLMKFTAYEAKGIEPLVASSPVMSWVYDLFSVTTFSALLGVVEVTAAVLLAVGLFVATLSFVVTAPGVFEASEGGFPMLGSTGQFLVKDVALLGISAWTLGDAIRRGRPRPTEG